MSTKSTFKLWLANYYDYSFTYGVSDVYRKYECNTLISYRLYRAGLNSNTVLFHRFRLYRAGR